MRKLISGKDYNFHIVVDQRQFYIEAIHINSTRFSFINNLNPILSEIDIDINDARVSESQWDIPIRKSKAYFKQTVEFLSDKYFRNYIEKTLTDDRELSEWVNFKNKI